MTDIAVRVENLGKRYRIGGPRAQYKTVRETLMGIAAAPARRLRRLGQPAPPAETLWALRHVSFDVARGEVVGIIGRNGAGKSTLLKIVSRITEPTEGYVKIDGRVSSLLEVGTGFHPELTGRENIYLNGAILGMKRTEIDRKFDEIVAFSEIEKFLDTPVKRYSSGMYVRLAFAVAAHLEPEILLVDEVLAVGDAGFQKKCLGKMGNVAQAGRTVLFVSHNMAAITALCKRAVLLESGARHAEGSVQEVVARYGTLLDQARTGDFTEMKDRRGSGIIRIAGIRWVDLDGRELSVLQSGQRLALEIAYTAKRPVRSPSFLVGVYDLLSRRLLFLDSSESGGLPSALPMEGHVKCIIDKLPLPPGTYRANLAIVVEGETADHITRAIEIAVVAGDFYGTGVLKPHNRACLLNHRWAASDDVYQCAPDGSE
ncbi:MAG TPA: ABC transporter ATP-binding protein [Anaerolineae bacterium]|nr:ABC transporter ATP-binding protein [Anaerolineae bacterium]